MSNISETRDPLSEETAKYFTDRLQDSREVMFKTGQSFDQIFYGSSNSQAEYSLTIEANHPIEIGIIHATQKGTIENPYASELFGIMFPDPDLHNPRDEVLKQYITERMGFTEDANSLTREEKNWHRACQTVFGIERGKNATGKYAPFGFGLDESADQFIPALLKIPRIQFMKDINMSDYRNIPSIDGDPDNWPITRFDHSLSMGVEIFRTYLRWIIKDGKNFEEAMAQDFSVLEDIAKEYGQTIDQLPELNDAEKQEITEVLFRLKAPDHVIDQIVRLLPYAKVQLIAALMHDSYTPAKGDFAMRALRYSEDDELAKHAFEIVREKHMAEFLEREHLNPNFVAAQLVSCAREESLTLLGRMMKHKNKATEEKRQKYGYYNTLAGMDEDQYNGDFMLALRMAQNILPGGVQRITEGHEPSIPLHLRLRLLYWGHFMGANAEEMSELCKQIGIDNPEDEIYIGYEELRFGRTASLEKVAWEKQENEAPRLISGRDAERHPNAHFVPVVSVEEAQIAAFQLLCAYQVYRGGKGSSEDVAEVFLRELLNGSALSPETSSASWRDFVAAQFIGQSDTYAEQFMELHSPMIQFLLNKVHSADMLRVNDIHPDTVGVLADGRHVAYMPNMLIIDEPNGGTLPMKSGTYVRYPDGSVRIAEAAFSDLLKSTFTTKRNIFFPQRIQSLKNYFAEVEAYGGIVRVLYLDDKDVAAMQSMLEDMSAADRDMALRALDKLTKVSISHEHKYQTGRSETRELVLLSTLRKAFFADDTDAEFDTEMP